MDPPDGCPECERAKPSPPFVFEGQFLDARCVEPVAHATLAPCTTLRVTGAEPVTIAVDPMARKRADQGTSHAVVRQLTRGETGKLFAKKDGTCAPYEPRGLKLAPEQCDGKKVCRQDNGDLACAGCRALTNGCPDYVETRAYVLLKK